MFGHYSLTVRATIDGSGRVRRYGPKDDADIDKARRFARRVSRNHPTVRVFVCADNPYGDDGYVLNTYLDGVKIEGD